MQTSRTNITLAEAKHGWLKGHHIPVILGDPVAVASNSYYDSSSGTYSAVGFYAFEYEGWWFWVPELARKTTLQGPCKPDSDPPALAPFSMTQEHPGYWESWERYGKLKRYRADWAEEREMLDYAIAREAIRQLEK